MELTIDGGRMKQSDDLYKEMRALIGADCGHSLDAIHDRLTERRFETVMLKIKNKTRLERILDKKSAGFFRMLSETEKEDIGFHTEILKQEVHRLYLDMDGVLADFDEGVQRILHLPIIKQGTKTPEEDNEMYGRMREVGNYYDMLYPMPGAVEMFEKIYGELEEKCEILTGIPKPSRGIDTAGPDKISWMKRLLSDRVVMNIVLRKEKILYCRGPEDILIDDYEKNLKEWDEAGGTSILHEDSESTLRKLKEMGILG
ncbi:MAG: hypothetical protein K6G07_04045 [Lachnospiraceae bacterium]|nr:hypothetical protein [Lachnospiraceae bacterium]